MSIEHDRPKSPHSSGVQCYTISENLFALAVLMKYETPVIPATGVRLMTLSLKVAT